jgi:hypothetical protein
MTNLKEPLEAHDFNRVEDVTKEIKKYTREILQNANNSVAYVAESKKDVKEIIYIAEKLSKGIKLIQVFKNNNSIILKLIPAYLYAALRYKDGSMRSKTIANEMIMFVAGEKNIGKAIKICGVSGTKFIIFATDASLIDVFLLKINGTLIKKLKLQINLDSGIATSA